MKKKVVKILLVLIALAVAGVIGGGMYLYNHGMSGKYANTNPKRRTDKGCLCGRQYYLWSWNCGLGSK